MSTIFTPRVCIDMLTHPLTKDIPNKQTCTKIMFMGFEISISMDSSHGPGDLSRSEIRVYDGNVDVTKDFLFEDETMLYGDSNILYRVMRQIDGQ